MNTNNTNDEEMASVYSNRFSKLNEYSRNKRNDRNNVVKTRPCRNIIENGECTRNACMFAHSENEIEIPICTYGDNCFRKTTETLRDGQTICKFKHPEETLIDYYKKLGFSIPLFPNHKTITLECSKLDIINQVQEAVNKGFNLFHIKILD